MKKNKLGLYIHIPFCERKCKYCDFLSFASSAEKQSVYVDNLVKEMSLWSEEVSAYSVDTVFIGGGTPTVLSVENMQKVLDALHEYFDLSALEEFTVECNPNSLTREKIECYQKGGVNRISIGMQSANDEEIQALGRLHNREQFEQAYHIVREAGIENINIDVMSAIPLQTKESYQKTLAYVMDLKPEHISSYSLIIEEGTPFFELYQDEPPIDEETDREMYELTKKMLAENGYERYEISNYALKEKECRHNLKYWRREAYLGLGLGASSMMNESRFSNTSSMEEYISFLEEDKKPVSDTEILTKEDAMAEYMYLGLRCMKGVSESDFEMAFGVRMLDQYGEVLHSFEEKKLLQKQEDYWSLTEQGIDVSNRIFAEFI